MKSKLLLNLGDLDPLIIVLIGSGVFMFFLLLLVDSLTGSYRVLKKCKKVISLRSPSIKKLGEQNKVLQEHASSYANTLGGEGAKLLTELDNIIKEQEELLGALDIAASNWDIDEITRIESEAYFSDNHLFIEKIKRADQIIQFISGRLAEASITATKLHVPKIQKKQTTIEGLWTAGLLDRKDEKS